MFDLCQGLNINKKKCQKFDLAKITTSKYRFCSYVNLKDP